MIPLPTDLEARLRDALQMLGSMPWFESWASSHPSAFVAADLSEAWDGYWDGWHGRSTAFWTLQSKELERVASPVLGNDGIDYVFEAVSRFVGDATWTALRRRIDEHEADSIVAGAIAFELHEAIKRDAAWGVVEAMLEKRGAFTEALSWYREGRRLFGWIDGYPPAGRPVIL